METNKTNQKKSIAKLFFKVFITLALFTSLCFNVWILNTPSKRGNEEITIRHQAAVNNSTDTLSQSTTINIADLIFLASSVSAYKTAVNMHKNELTLVVIIGMITGAILTLLVQWIRNNRFNNSFISNNTNLFQKEKNNSIGFKINN